MDSTLQYKAWWSLPEKYREEVASMYETLVNYDDGSSIMREKRELMEYLYGKYHLSSYRQWKG